MQFLRRKWQPTPVHLPGKSHGQRSLVGYSPWGRKELDTTKQLHFHFGGGVKQNDVVRGSAYMHGFSFTQPVSVFWLVHLIYLHLR